MYDYSKVHYVDSSTPVTIVCPVHGDFSQIPNNHLRGMGCRFCAGKDITVDEFIRRANEVHNNKYTYKNTVYTRMNDYVEIECPVHGPFRMQANQHVNLKSGCQKCAGNHHKSTAEFVHEAKLIHDDQYDYNNVVYVNNITPVEIGCRLHGSFFQTPSDHILQASGCPRCNGSTSRGERQIRSICESLADDVLANDRTVIPPYELDIVIPSHRVAIEYCGVYYHCDKFRHDPHYHETKMRLCRERGYRLLTIFEDEWVEKRDIIVSKLHTILGQSSQPRIYARHCSIVTVDREHKSQFHNSHHIQGDGPSSINYGLCYNGSLVCVISFTSHRNGVFYLTRFSSSCRVVGGFTKLLQHFQRMHKWSTLITFADKRWSEGQLYFTTGWTHDSDLPPDYHYTVDGKRRIHKFNFRHNRLRHILSNYDPSVSEYINCRNHGIYRVWDCGKMRFVLNQKSEYANE